MSSITWISYCDLFFATITVFFSFLLNVLHLCTLQWLQINWAGFFMKKEQVVGNSEDPRTLQKKI